MVPRAIDLAECETWLNGHVWVNYVLNFQGRRVAGEREKVSLGRMVEGMEALVRSGHVLLIMCLE